MLADSRLRHVHVLEELQRRRLLAPPKEQSSLDSIGPTIGRQARIQMEKYKIPKEIFEHGHCAIYVSHRIRSEEWLKCGITSFASVAFRSCLNTQGQVRAKNDPKRKVLAGSWIPRRFAIIGAQGHVPPNAQHAGLRDIENQVRAKLKKRISDSHEMSLDTHYLRNDYFRLPLDVTWTAIEGELRHAGYSYRSFDLAIR